MKKVWPWLATVLVIVATCANALGYPSQVLFFVACVMWMKVGMIWKQPSLFYLNLFCASIYLIGFFK